MESRPVGVNISSVIIISSIFGLFRTLIESRPVGVKHISMEARVSDNGIIKEVKKLSKRYTFFIIIN